jgi:hypothetical protein
MANQHQDEALKRLRRIARDMRRRARTQRGKAPLLRTGARPRATGATRATRRRPPPPRGYGRVLPSPRPARVRRRAEFNHAPGGK